MYFSSRKDEVAFLKKMWQEQNVLCPKCNSGTLEHLHKKAKKSNTDWMCPKCGEIYRTIRLLKELPND